MKQKITKLLFIFFAFTCFLSIIARIYISSELSTKGEEIRKLESEIDLLNRQNKELKGKIALESSLGKIKEKALAMGMVDAPKPEFLTSSITASISGQPGF